MDNQDLRNSIDSLDEQIQILQVKRLELLLEYEKKTSGIVANDILENITMPSKRFLFVEYRTVANQVVMLVRRHYHKQDDALSSIEFYAISDTWKKIGSLNKGRQ